MKILLCQVCSRLRVVRVNLQMRKLLIIPWNANNGWKLDWLLRTRKKIIRVIVSQLMTIFSRGYIGLNSVWMQEDIESFFPHNLLMYNRWFYHYLFAFENEGTVLHRLSDVKFVLCAKKRTINIAHYVMVSCHSSGLPRKYAVTPIVAPAVELLSNFLVMYVLPFKWKLECLGVLVSFSITMGRWSQYSTCNWLTGANSTVIRGLYGRYLWSRE